MSIYATLSMFADLKIIVWPDPRLKKVSAPVQQFGDELAQLAQRMFELMRQARGVGLAAPQVGLNIRMFVMNHSGEPQDDRVYVNPVLSDPAGEEEDDEGCLSLPGITASILRSEAIRMQAQDVTGQSFEQTEIGYIPRIWQHETDHLNGVLLTDRMGETARIACRKTLREIEERYSPRK
jgi:peptide deformylase